MPKLTPEILTPLFGQQLTFVDHDDGQFEVPDEEAVQAQIWAEYLIQRQEYLIEEASVLVEDLYSRKICEAIRTKKPRGPVLIIDAETDLLFESRYNPDQERFVTNPIKSRDLKTTTGRDTNKFAALLIFSPSEQVILSRKLLQLYSKHLQPAACLWVVETKASQMRFGQDLGKAVRLRQFDRAGAIKTESKILTNLLENYYLWEARLEKPESKPKTKNWLDPENDIAWLFDHSSRRKLRYNLRDLRSQQVTALKQNWTVIDRSQQDALLQDCTAFKAVMAISNNYGIRCSNPCGCEKVYIGLKNEESYQNYCGAHEQGLDQYPNPGQPKNNNGQKSKLADQVSSPTFDLETLPQPRGKFLGYDPDSSEPVYDDTLKEEIDLPWPNSPRSIIINVSRANCIEDPSGLIPTFSPAQAQVIKDNPQRTRVVIRNNGQRPPIERLDTDSLRKASRVEITPNEDSQTSVDSSPSIWDWHRCRPDHLTRPGYNTFEAKKRSSTSSPVRFDLRKDIPLPPNMQSPETPWHYKSRILGSDVILQDPRISPKIEQAVLEYFGYDKIPHINYSARVIPQREMAADKESRMVECMVVEISNDAGLSKTERYFPVAELNKIISEITQTEDELIF